MQPDQIDRLAEQKIIFLDIDGVLNGHEWDDEAKSCSIRRECVKHLSRIIRDTGAKLVISSAWRYMILNREMTDCGFGYMLRTHGLISGQPGSVVIGHVGPDGDPNNLEDRAEQILAWIERHEGIGCSLILDDEDFGFSRHGLPFIQTDSATGLTAADADRAIAWLNQGA